MTKKICNVLSMVVFLGLLVIAGFLFVPKMLGYGLKWQHGTQDSGRGDRLR